MMPNHPRLQRADTAAMSKTPPPRARTGRRLSLQPTPTRQPSLSPPVARVRRAPSPTPPRTQSTAGSTSSSSTSSRNPVTLSYKILMLGSERVGKTSIIQQFLYHKFNPKYHRTIEELHESDFIVDNCTLSLDILDTSGTLEFPAMMTLNIASSNAFILVYAIDDEGSFDEILSLRNQVVRAKGDKIPIVIVGNKSDLDLTDRKVDERRARRIVQRWKHGFVECSALTNEGIEEIFKELMVQANVTYSLSPALRRRRQSLPGRVAGAHGMPPMAVHVPTPAQLAALKDRHSKRNSCSMV